jgi:hypothetical protein
MKNRPVHRIYFLALLLIVANQSRAQSADTDLLWGVWGARADGAEIRLCVQSDPARPFSGNFAAIYDTRNFRIDLLDRDGDETWRPRLHPEQTVFLARLEGGSVRLEGVPTDLWSGVVLSPFRVSGEEEPCAERAFNGARAFLPAPVETAAERDGVSYETVSITDPFGHGEVTTFQLTSTTQGPEKVNTWLAEFLPRTTESAPYYTCTIDALRSGAGSFWHHQMRPELITDRLIVIEAAEDVFCGGAHPSSSIEWHVFNMETGAEIDTTKWIRPDAFYRLGPYASQGPEVGDPNVEVGFRDLMTEAFLATHPSDGCRDLLDWVETWNIRPGREGLILSPSGLDDAPRGCAVDLNFTEQQIAPYTTDQYQWWQ